MSALPKQVRAQAERANQLAKEFLERQNPAPDASAAPPPDTNGAPPPDTNGAPPPDTNSPPPDAAKVTQIPAADPDHKYKVLQGKYNAEVPRLQKTVHAQSEQITSLQQQLVATQNLLASLGGQRSAAPAQPAQDTPPAPVKLIKDEERREFGDDLIDLMRRVVREETASLPQEIDRRVAPVARTVEQVASATEQAAQRDAEDRRLAVFALLDAQVPKWKEINGDDEFLSWLDQNDPYAGVPRGKLLQQAFQAHDGPRVVAFFRGYQNEHAVVTPAAPAPAPAPAPQRKLEQLVAPGSQKAGSTGTQDGSGKRVWTAKEIRLFYADKQNNPRKYTPEQWKAYEKDIFAAQSEGRIR